MMKNQGRKWVRVTGMVSASIILMGGVVTSAFAASRDSAKMVITMELPQGTGYASSPQNAVLVSLVKKYEKLHPNVTVALLPNAQANPPAQTAWLTTVAAGQSAPDIVDEFYLLVNAGAVPAGILQNLKPFLYQPDPYLGGKPWISAWNPIYRADMTSPDGNMYMLLGAEEAISVIYNKQQFRQAGIAAPPKTYAQWVQDMIQLKKHGFTPLMFGTAHGNAEPSWWERKVQTQLLQRFIPQIDVNHSKILSGLDLAVGVEKGIISMKNPAYAEVWKLLGSLTPYMAPDASEYATDATLTSVSPPLSVIPGFAKSKYSMIFGGAWDIKNLYSLGMKGKFGIFPFPQITKASTPYASISTGAGSVAGPNGAPEYAVTTPAANKTMTPQKLKQIVNLLEYLYSPANEGQVVADEGNQASFPTITGAKVSVLPGVGALVPKKFTPVVEGVLNDGLSAQAEVEGSRIVQEYLGGSISFSDFSSQWDALLQSAAAAWAQTNHVNLSQYLHSK